MSKKQRMGGKGFIPTEITGKVFNSLSEFGAAFGIKPAEQPTPKAKNCRKCGTAMRNIPGTNVWVCDGMVENAEKKTVPCGNRAMTTVRSANQIPENSGKPKQQKNRGNHQGKPAQATTA